MHKRRHVIIMVVWAVLLVVAVVVLWDRLFPADEPTAGTPTALVPADEPMPGTPAALARLVGQWRRLDGGYVLDIQGVHDDGKIDAAYLNPRPIHVSKADAITQGGHVVVVVTLQDRGYPGNMYTLTYDADADRLEGVYHHRGLKQQFNVTFVRASTTPNRINK